MVERFVAKAGTISIGTGESTVVGVGTSFGGRDREGAQVWVQPAGAAPYRIGTVAAVDPAGVYEDLSLPLVTAWNGSPVVSQPYELIDGLAMANGATQAATYARFTAFLQQNMGLAGNTADEIDYSLVPNNSLFIDAATRTIYQWRSGVLNVVYSVGLAFTPQGLWVGTAEAARHTLSIYSGDAVDLDGDDGPDYILTFDDDFQVQLPINVEEGDILDVVFIASGAGHTPSFVTGYTGDTDAISTAAGARTRLQLVVTAASAGYATAVTATEVTFAENDLVEHLGRIYVSNADDNGAEPAGETDENWTLLPPPVLDGYSAYNVTLIDAATIAVDMADGYNFGGGPDDPLTLTDNRALGAPTNVVGGRAGVMWFAATGSTRTLTANAAYELGEGVEAGPYAIPTTKRLGLAYVTLGETVIFTGVIWYMP